MTTLRDRAAAALDATHTTLKGIDTPKARAVIAEWLDGARHWRIATVRVYVEYLEMIARS